MTFHIKIMVAHQHDQSIFTWGKLPPLLLCMRMSRLTHKKGERIKKRKSCQPFLSANKEESAVGQITDVLPHKNDHYCAKILSDFLACFHSELCHKRFWQACPSIRQTHTMRDSVRAQAVPTWWPSPGTACCSARCKNCQYKTIYLFSDRIYYSTDSPVKMSLSLWGGSSLRIWFQTSDLLPSGPVTKSDHKPFSQQPCQYKKSKDAQLSIIALLKVNENSLISVLTQCWPVISFQNDCWVVSGLNCYFIIVPKMVSVPRGTTGHCSVTNHKSSSNKYIQIQKEQREKKQKHWRFQDVDLRRFLRC